MIKNSLLLQLQANEGSDSVTLLQLIEAGGWVMYPIFLLSFVTIYIFVERFLTIRAAAKGSDQFIEDVKSYVASGDVAGAKELCDAHNSPVSRMIGKGISRIGNDLKNIEASIENVAKIEINKLEKNLSMLATTSGAAPMIGFLGTVIGMIKTFIELNKGGAEGGRPDFSQMSAGIYEALVTTVAGLIVGIVAYVAFNYLTSQIQKIIHKMEFSAVEFIDLLQEPTE